MKLRLFTSVAALAYGITLSAATPPQLQPYLEYPPIQSKVGQTAGTGGMSHALLVMPLDPMGLGVSVPAIIASEYGSNPNSVVAFRGFDGSPILGWESGAVRPSGNSAGYAHLAGTTTPFPRIIASFAQKPALVVGESGAILGQFSYGNYYSSAVAIGGYRPGMRHDSTAAYFGGEDLSIHRVTMFWLSEEFGWPKSHSNSAQRVATPAIIDLNGDYSPEIFSAGGGSSSGFQVKAHDGISGSLSWQHQFNGGYAASYLAIGQILPDDSLEVAVVHRMPTTPFTPRLSIIDAVSGIIEATLDLPGTVSYGSAPVLADLNSDGLDDVIVLTAGRLSAISGGNLQQLPGFPFYLGDVRISDSAPIVGDIGGPNGSEIVLITEVPGVFARSEVHIINQAGIYMMPRFSMDISPRTGGIHDLDNDGHNELIIAARGAATIAVQDSIWVFDFSRNEPTPTTHGAVLWGQFGQNSERCNCSIIALKSIKY